MLSKLTPISRIDLIKRLRKFGFIGPYQGGKNQFMVKDDIRLTLPNPHYKEVGVDFPVRDK
ncbi:type II toxin-antitoxin system HicA family toxin [candidate division WOR-3 bacterium]|nr:type II toxin-antitoxin system HicA family toxin [candidate division WOR-3 bacterium]